MGEAVFGSQMGNVLTKLTVVLAVVFLANTTVLAIIGKKPNTGTLTDTMPASTPPAVGGPPQSQPGQFGGTPGQAPVGLPPAVAPAPAPAPVPVEVPADAWAPIDGTGDGNVPTPIEGASALGPEQPQAAFSPEQETLGVLDQAPLEVPEVEPVVIDGDDTTVQPD